MHVIFFALSLLLTPTTPLTAATQAKIDAALAAPAFKNASIGVCVRPLEGGNNLYEHNADLALIPASNEKLLTSTVALTKLGPAFTFSTDLLTNGTVTADGTLKGDLYLRGSGDPSLNQARLTELAKALAGSGVKHITGRILGDGSAFDEQLLGEGWEWDDEQYYYSAQVSGLNCDENVVAVAVRPGAKVGAPATVSVDGLPATTETFVEIENKVTTVDNTDKAAKAKVSFDRARGKNHVIITGTIPIGASPISEAITIEDPTRFTASRLDLALTAAGITIDMPLGYDTGVTPIDARKLVSVTSQPLTGLLKDFLKPSDNLYGEAILKAVGHVALPTKPGSSASGATAIEGMLTDAGVSTDGLHIVDGSGLSRLDTVTPRLLCDLLTSVVNQRFFPETKTAFLDALPVSGTDGTLRNRFKGTPLVGKVQGKTGTLNGVSSLSGYVTTKSGERLAFSILMNNFAHTGGSAAARDAQDAIVQALYDN